jgi:arsenite methyltransferase
LGARVRDAMCGSIPDGTVHWEAWECFEPAPPEPTHRHAFRCGTGDDASCCAAFYDRAEVRYLLGDSLHPGGVDLTLLMAEHLALDAGHRILDVACGSGTSLKAVEGAYSVRGLGLDAGIVDAPRGEDSPRGLDLRRGDAHDIPFADGSFDAVLCECAVSTFFDQPRALREMRRVLKPGGRVALSDMVVTGAVPEELRDWVNVGTCLAGAQDFEGYRSLLEQAGLRVVAQWDASDGLHEMLARIKRNLVGLALAKTLGNLPTEVDIDVKEGRAVIKEAERAVRAGTIAYGAYVAERVE